MTVFYFRVICSFKNPLHKPPTLRHLNLMTVIPDLDVFHANVVEGAANVSFSEFFSTGLKTHT